MLLLYNIGINIYYGLVYLASIFNNKANLWIKGRREQRVRPLESGIWFHFASLGEFEQGRPVLEKTRMLYPHHKIVITFFSPSGYEIRKNTPLADAVYYLPLDTAKNAQEFISAIKPVMAVFTKYEYWYHYFNELHKQHVPLYIISRSGNASMIDRRCVQHECELAATHLLVDKTLIPKGINQHSQRNSVWLNAL